MSHYTHEFLRFCTCQNHQIRHHRALIVAPSNVKKCDVNEDRANRSQKGGVVLCGKIQHLRASIAGTSLGKSLFDVFLCFFHFRAPSYQVLKQVALRLSKVHFCLFLMRSLWLVSGGAKMLKFGGCRFFNPKMRRHRSFELRRHIFEFHHVW